MCLCVVIEKSVRVCMKKKSVPVSSASVRKRLWVICVWGGVYKRSCTLAYIEKYHSTVYRIICHQQKNKKKRSCKKPRTCKKKRRKTSNKTENVLGKKGESTNSVGLFIIYVFPPSRIDIVSIFHCA